MSIAYKLGKTLNMISPAISARAPLALEWDKFLSLAEKAAKSAPAKTKIRALLDPKNWACDLHTSNHRQAETSEAALLLNRESLWAPLEDLEDPEPVIERLIKGSVLETQELAFLRRWLYALDAATQIPRDEIRGDLFKKALSSLPDPYEPIRILDRLLTPEGEISERASPSLNALYSEIRSLKKDIAVLMDQLLKNFSHRGLLQDQYTDVRDGRYVLPIKISSQSEVDGIIFEASASRQTVFIEPKEVSPLNNRLKQRQNELVQEIFTVLSTACAALRPFAPEFLVGIEIITHWDAVQARASLGRHYSGHSILVKAEREFKLTQTAHPMLWFSLSPENIIRNDLEFHEPWRTLLITGPNTGGKTVLLKTLGLAGLCARTGFQLPGSSLQEVPFFDSFFADLGDPQSIDEQLSSFSGHILKFKEILEHVSPDSLVLIDELNTATDPDEGAALGRAFLETLMSKGAMIVTTTHDPHLKALAVSDDRILNAGMEFDESSRIPTFLLVPGIPGRSRALETAERLGLPQAVLTLAKNYLSKEHNLFESMLARLERDTHEATRARNDAVRLRQEAETLKKEWLSRTEMTVNELLAKTRQKLRHIMEQAQDEVRTKVQKLDEARTRKDLDQARFKLNETSTLSTERIFSALKEEAPEVFELLHKDHESASSPLPEAKPVFSVGLQVRVPRWKALGVIIATKADKFRVALGNLQVTLSGDELQTLGPQELRQAEQIKEAQNRRTTKDATPPPPLPTIDLRGERYDEAMSKLEAWLDQAFRSGVYAEVTVVHGLGSGALREGTRSLLKSLPYIKTFRDGGKGQGGTGATLVEFER